MSHRTDSGLSKLLEDLKVPILVSTDSSFAQKAAPYNLRLPYKPEVIAIPQTVAQVYIPLSQVPGGLKGLSTSDRSKPRSNVPKSPLQRLLHAVAAIAMHHSVSAGRMEA